MPAISILLPVYNAAGTLPECIASLDAQTLADYEVIAVDDGSQDGTPSLLRAWAERDRRVRLLSLAHGGIVVALQSGLAECRGRFVARMDADDRSHPERLDKQFDFLEAHPEVDVVSSRVRAFPEEDVRDGFRVYLEWLNALLTPEQIRREIFVESPLPHPSVMFRRDAVLAAGGYQEHGWAEDYDLWLRMHLAGSRFAKLPETLLDWRERPDRLTRSDSRYSLENFLREKAHYLALGPLRGRDGVFIWGAGMMGRRISKHLLRAGALLAAFIDIDPKKIGGTRRGKPIIAPEALESEWGMYRRPVLLSAVGARGARVLIRERLVAGGMREGIDWWAVA